MEVNKKATVTIALPSQTTEGWLTVRFQSEGNDTTFAIRPQKGRTCLRQNGVELTVDGEGETVESKPATKAEPVEVKAEVKPAEKTAPMPLYAKQVKSIPKRVHWSDRPSPLKALTYRAFRRPGDLLNAVAAILAYSPRPHPDGFTSNEILLLLHGSGGKQLQSTGEKNVYTESNICDVRNKTYTLQSQGLVKARRGMTDKGTQIYRFLWQGENGSDWMKEETPSMLLKRLQSVWKSLPGVKNATDGVIRCKSLRAIVRNHTCMSLEEGVRFFVDSGFVVACNSYYLIVRK